MTCVELGIADVVVSVRSECPALTLSPLLGEFLICQDADERNLELVVEAGPPPPVQMVNPLESAHIRGARTPDGFWFERVRGAMWAAPDVSRCRAWTGRPDDLSRPFNGRPWLMFALWGYLAQRGGVFLHGATCVLEGRHVLLLADSQVGKSTLARLSAEAGYTALTDEYPAVTCAGARIRAHGLPWPGRQGPPAPASGELAAVFFLRQAPANALEQLAPPEIGRRLMRNARFFGWDPATTLPALESLDRIARAVPGYEAAFTPSPQAVEMLVQVL
ncbi:MAG TPA: hypothetical protein VM283_05000 [Armatimonadota bacterium]|nr:hypothetical protein [Armatimonadota bacterium]